MCTQLKIVKSIKKYEIQQKIIAYFMACKRFTKNAEQFCIASGSKTMPVHAEQKKVCEKKIKDYLKTV